MIEKIIDELKRILSQKRYEHSIRVFHTAVELAKIYDEDIEKTSLASLLHDYAKCFDDATLRKIIADEDIVLDEVLSENIGLAHGLASAIIAKKTYHIEDQDILNAIQYHTYGRPNMSRLEKIVYLADYIEPDRKFAGLEDIRKVAREDLNQGVLMALNASVKYILSKNEKIYTLSLDAIEYYSDEVLI
ncbi:MAG: bis(5'-nucleosyl)-tetraphosphatase (symmetrical) YqeK [Clostridiales bacterium]|nr:bis(5'-nucleosyl)-tetraphosphatase (symmetrical) YqeK [Clostridiales bacterium]